MTKEKWIISSFFRKNQLKEILSLPFELDFSNMNLWKWFLQQQQSRSNNVTDFLIMDWLIRSIERDLGVDRRQQGPGLRPREVVALVPSRWVLALRDRRITRCARFDGVSEAEIQTYIHSCQAKLPPGWTRVCIQALRKSKLNYRLARDACHQPVECLSPDSYVKTMQRVSQHNIRYYPHIVIFE